MVTTNFIKKVIDSKYLETVTQSLYEILGKSYNVEVQVLGIGNQQNHKTTTQVESPFPIKNSIGKKSDLTKSTSFFIENLEPTKDDLYKAIDSKVIEHQTSNNPIQIDLNKTFANFIIGPSNNIAHALAYSVAKDPGKTYSALYI